MHMTILLFTVCTWERICQKAKVTFIDSDTVGIHFKLQYGMMRKSDKFNLLRCFLKSFGFLIEISSGAREFQGLIIRDEKKYLDVLFLQSGSSSLWWCPRSAVQREQAKKSLNWSAEWPLMILQQVSKSVMSRRCSSVWSPKMERRSE